MRNLREDRKAPPRPPTQTERVFKYESLWYFKTREGDDVGPFRHCEDAKSGLAQFINKMKNS